jgi:hypothetical protein
MTDTKIIHALDPDRGLTLSVYEKGADPMTARPIVIPYGGQIELTRELIEAARDREGFSFLEETEAEQIARYGHRRFGVGPVPESIKADLKAQRRAKAERERAALIQMNPNVAAAAAGLGRLAQLDRELAELDAEAQAS